MTIDRKTYAARHMLIIAIGLFMGASSAFACSVADISIKHMKAGFVNECRTKSCYSLKGIATLTNRCAAAIGVQVKITGYDKQKIPVATREPWPASVRNIPPGDYSFSLDTVLDYDSSISSFSIEPINVRRWNQ